MWQTLARLRRLTRLQPSPSPRQAPADDEIRLAAIGATAVTVAVCRAAEAERAKPWFTDQLAEHVARTAEPARDTNPRPGLIFWIAVRTRFLDELVLDAVNGGVRQVVLLGSGLDARAFRLEVSDDVVFFEVDRSSVHGLKSRLLTQIALTTTCRRRVVVADLTSSEWLVALRAQGWSSDEPTCWIAEGLLIYLDVEARDTLLGQLAAASPPGSRLGATVTTAQRASQVSIWESGVTGDPVHWLADVGWHARVRRLPEVAEEFGRPVRVATQGAEAAMLVEARPARETPAPVRS